MISAQFVAVAQDAFPSAVPPRLLFTIPAGETGRIYLKVVHADGATAYNLTGCQLLLTVENANPSRPPLISHQATVTDAVNGLAYFDVAVGDTANAELGQYQGDVWLTDANFTPNKRFQVVGAGLFLVQPALGVPDQPVTTGTAFPPIAIGPPGFAVFDPTVNYAVGQAVSYFVGGSWGIYQCSVATTAGDLPTDTTHWIQLSSGTGLPGVTTADNGKALMVRAGAWTPSRILASDVVPPFAITSFNVPAGIEFGATLVNPSGTVGYNRTPVSAQVTDGTLTDTLSSPFTAWSLTHTYGPASAINQFVTFTASAVGDDGGTPSTSASTYIGLGRAYWGMVDDPGSGGYTSAFANALASNRLQTGRGASYAFGSGDGVKYPFLVIPVAWGDFAALVDQNQDSLSFTKVASAVNVVNGQSVNVPCNFYRIDAQPVSAITVAGS